MSSYSCHSIIVLLLLTLCNIDLTPAQFVIHHPPSIAGPYESLRASFSAVIPPLESGITSRVVLATPCTTLNSTIVSGKIVISTAPSSTCLFWTQAQNVISAGGLALILWRDQPTLQPLLYTSSTTNISIPTMSVSISVANSIMNEIRINNRTVNMTIGYTPAPAAQKQALLDFWNALGGSKWRFGSAGLYNEWKASTDPCSSWYGIACNAITGDIRGISLPLNQLSGTIPASISALTQLGQIQLTTNSGLRGPLPVEFFQFPRMRFMEVQSCALTGSIPEEIGVMTRLTWLKFDTNQMSGTLPTALSTLTNITVLLLNGNKFTGPIPTDIGNLNLMTQMSLSKNTLSGTLPASLGNMVLMNRLELASNSFFGAMPTTLGQLTLMTFFDISSNQFEGALPQFPRLVSLGYLNVGNNKFSGELPNFATSKLLALDISNNQLSGTISGSQLPTGLTILKAAHNQFVALASFSSNIYLSYLDVSYNNLSSLASLQSLAKVTLDQVNTGISGLTFIDMSHNQMVNVTQLFDAGLGGFPSLLTMDLSYNKLRGVLTPPSDVSVSQNLQTLDFSNNFISGTIPEVFAQMPSLTTFTLVNNELHHGVGSLLPLFASVDYSVLQDNITGNFFCPSFGASKSINFKLNIDSSYHDFFKCVCKEGYRRLPNTTMLVCDKCPEHMICSGGQNDANYSFEMNYWPTPSFEHPEFMLPCPNCLFAEPSKGSMCGDGYTGRLCSECSDGFYLSSGQKCNSCAPSGLLLFSVVILIVAGIIAGFTIIAIKFGNVVELAHTKSIELSSTNVHANSEFKTTTGNPVARAFAAPPSVPSKIFSRWKYFSKFSFEPSIAIITIIINYTQTLSILTRNLSLNYSFRQFISAIEIANISGTGFGVECVNDIFAGMIPRYLFTSLQPLFVTGCALLAILAGVFVIKIMLKQNYKWWMIVCMRSWLFLMDFLFFPVVLNCIAYFKCTEDPGTKEFFLDEYPFARCSSVPQDYKFAFLFVNLFGIIVLFSLILWHYKYTKSKTRKMHIKAVFGFFFEQYKPQYIWVGLLYLARRLLFSIFNGLLQPHSLELYICNMVFICISVLSVYASRPFKRPVDNSYEIASYVTLAFAYSILYVGYFTQTGIIMVVFYFFANAALYLNFVIVLILSKFPSLSQIRSFVLCEWARARVERFDDSEE